MAVLTVAIAYRGRSSLRPYMRTMASLSRRRASLLWPYSTHPAGEYVLCIAKGNPFYDDHFSRSSVALRVLSAPTPPPTPSPRPPPRPRPPRYPEGQPRPNPPGSPPPPPAPPPPPPGISPSVQ